MGKCTDIGGLIAATQYEPLNDREQATLDKHLAQCEHCREEAKAMAQFVKKLPTTPIAFQGDLRPVLEQSIRDRQSRSQGWRWLAPLAVGAMLIAVMLSQNWLIAPNDDALTPTTTLATDASENEVKALLEEARMLARGDFAGSQRLLTNLLARFPEAKLAGEAQLTLAELEFGHGQRYEEAYTAYAKLKTNYYEIFKESGESIARLDLLDEVRAHNFSPLYQLDASELVDKLEQVIASYPNTLVAQWAVTAMCQVVGGNDAQSNENRVAALEKLLDQCTHPSALGQISLAKGDIYRDLNNLDKARRSYQEAVERGDPILAQVAQERHAQLNAAALP